RSKRDWSSDVCSSDLNATEGSLEEQYAYFISNTGFPTDEHGCLSEPKPSPYPYDEHSMIYCCDDLPHPTKEHEAFIEQGVQRLRSEERRVGKATETRG